ncbi:acid phosphatase [Phenylobacterium sp.]|uniref:acid phosphatase n=1 Tax=Phenylobacterium sp. TaxID=1871053 RepID=UPI0039834429
MRTLTIAVLAALMGGAAPAQVAPAPALPRAYLTPQTWPDAAQILPPAPATGSAQERAELAVFTATRSLKDTPRWALAQNDVPTGVPNMMTNFSCALGVALTPAAAPKLTSLMSRVGLTVGAQVASVKDVFKRQRPYLLTKGEICVPQAKALDESPDYPSGHSTWGWAFGLVLAELAPDRATPLLVRGRAYGESRVVCGVHTAGAVTAGRTNGAAVLAGLHGDAQFRADLEAARAELAAVRASSSAPVPAACATEAGLTARTPY